MPRYEWSEKPRFASGVRRMHPLYKAMAAITLIFLFMWGYNHSHSYGDSPSLSADSSRQTVAALTAAHSRSKGKSPRIAMVTFITDQKSYIYLSTKNKRHYAKRHGYDLIIDYEEHAERGTMWYKFDMIERIIRAGTHDWIWWLDFDTLITNTTTPVTDVIDDALANITNPKDVDFILTNDCNQLNAGSFLARSSNNVIKFFDNVRRIHDEEQSKGESKSEQDCMLQHLRSGAPGTSVPDRILYIPQWKLNAFPEEIGCFDDHSGKWERGNFVLHFAGAWAHVKEDDPTGFLMKKYEGQIVWGPWEEQVAVS